MNRALILGGLIGLTACSSDPADVAGDYTVNITDEANGCMFANWSQGATASNIGVEITQSGGHATVQVVGVAGGLLAAATGSDTWEASVDGSHVGGTIHGTVQQPKQGNCSYFRNAQLAGSLTGDTLEGTISYTAETNHDPDCATLETCSSIQDFNGLRPPK